MTDLLQSDFAAEPASARSARRETAAVLIDRVERPLFDDVLMVVTELVSNAVAHTGGGCTLTLRHLDRRLVVEVEDADTRACQPDGHRDDNEELGRGLGMVQSLADRWGIERTAGGKCVWAEFTCDASSDDAQGQEAGP